MNPEAELHALLLKLRDVEQRAKMHRERAERRWSGRRRVQGRDMRYHLVALLASEQT